MGDFNTAMSNKDRKSGNIDSSKYHLEKCIKQLCLNDIWKNQNQNLNEYTWESNGNSNMKSRIDCIFVSKNLVPLTKCCDITPAPVSDYKSVLLKITNQQEKSGPNLWKLNTSVLKETSYCSQIEALFDKVLQDCSYFNLNKRVIWDLYKVKVKEFSLKYSLFIAQLQKDIIDKLENDISVLNRAL